VTFGRRYTFRSRQSALPELQDIELERIRQEYRNDFAIQRIAENTKPESEKIITAGAPVRAVLEVIGGTARKLGIRAGDRVRTR
jgi:uncharacterized protein